jgi:hypothetical protein
MLKENPRAGGNGARAQVSLGRDRSPNTNRPILKASPAMRQRLALLLWGRQFGGARHA